MNRMRRVNRIPRRWLRACALGIVLLLGFFLISSPRRNLLSPLSKSNPYPNWCPDSSFADNVVVAIKTGVTEAAEKIPIHIQTSLRCAKDKNVLVFSDVEQDIGKYHIYDALDNVEESVMKKNSDFKIYEDQYRLWRSKSNVTSLKSVKHPNYPDHLAGWMLDKYKNLHILEKTWALKPDKDWYIFVDADTYLFWPTILMWLKTLDPKKMSYFGSDVGINGPHFGHGGSGIILSGAAMFEVAVTHNGTAAIWDPRVSEHCCGEVPFSLALEGYGILLQDTWPLMSGENPSTLPVGPGNPEYWCRPAMTMHHINPTSFQELADFERQRTKPLEPLTHAEIFKELILNKLPSEREEWDNQSGDKGEFGLTGGKVVKAESFEACAEACEADETCFQYLHHGRTCNIGMSVRHGVEREAEDGEIWRSGWHKSRILAWLEKQPPCDEVVFPEQYDPPTVFYRNPFVHNRYNQSQPVQQRQCVLSSNSSHPARKNLPRRLHCIETLGLEDAYGMNGHPAYDGDGSSSYDMDGHASDDMNGSSADETGGSSTLDSIG